MSYTVFSFISQMPLAIWLFDWYQNLFNPQVSIAMTLIVCLVVIWISGALFDNRFKNKKLLLAIIKTAIIGVVLFSVLKATGEGGGKGDASSGSEITDSEKTETDAAQDTTGELSPDAEPPSTHEPTQAPVERDPVDISITYSKDGVTIEYNGTSDSLRGHPTQQVIFNKLKTYLKDNQCFREITIKLELDINPADFNKDIDELKKLLKEDHKAQNNATEIKFHDLDATGDKK